MKIINSEGCTAYYTRVDDKDLHDLSKDEQLELLVKLCENLKTNYSKNIELDWLIKELLDLTQEDEFEDMGYCEQCNDDSYRRIYNI